MLMNILKRKDVIFGQKAVNHKGINSHQKRNFQVQTRYALQNVGKPIIYIKNETFRCEGLYARA